jgi:hypothetical protein
MYEAMKHSRVTTRKKNIININKNILKSNESDKHTRSKIFGLDSHPSPR